MQKRTILLTLTLLVINLTAELALSAGLAWLHVAAESEKTAYVESRDRATNSLTEAESQERRAEIGWSKRTSRA